MSLPKVRNAYQDCFALYDKALEAPHGIRFRVASSDIAINLRMRLHTARTVDRDENSALHPRGTPMHANSVYDPLQVLIRTDDDACWVYIEPRTVAIIGDIEELTPYTEDPLWLAQNSPQRLISHSGTEPLPKRLEYSSNAPSESSSSTPSTLPEREPTIPGLRRL